MNRSTGLLTSVCLAFSIAACGSNTNGQGGGGGSLSDSGGSAGSVNGGSGGNANGGAGGNAGSGGADSGGSPAGGAAGQVAGGAAGKGNGGAAGNPAGGAAGKGNGGAAGGSAGGAAGSPAGGAAGKGSGGAAGSPAGGAAGAGTGGVQSSGGAGSGGNTSSGGGGSAPPSTACVTSASGAYWKSATCTEATSGTADVTVDDSAASQTWEGFGGAFNELGWSFLTSKTLQDQAMQLLFGVDGAHFAWGRIPMGASDYAMDRYTLDETAGDTAMASFSIERDKQKLIPYIKAAQTVKSDLRFWASPWTPPTWMKTGQKSGNKPSPFDGGNFKTDETTSKALAAYFVKFVQAYKEQGINVEVVAPQNEPNFDQNYPSCLWDKTTFTNFIGKHLGPALKSAGLGTKIMLGTMSNGDGGKDPDIAAAVLADSTAKSFCSVAGVQWGMLDASKTSGMKSAGLPIWASEHKCGNYPWNPSGSPAYNSTQAPNDQAYAVESWGYLRDAISKVGVTSYNAWNMVLDKKGLGIDTTRDWKQNALLVVDGGQIIQTPAYYVFRHFSQFVDPGAKVVKTGANDAIAFKNPDGTIVLVMYNSGAAKTSTVSIGGKKIQFSMPGSGWATIKR